MTETEPSAPLPEDIISVGITALETALIAETERAADEGHTFEVTVRSRMSIKVVGDEHNTDSDWWGEPWQATFRAWSLSEAMEKASRAPLADWFNADPCRHCGTVGRVGDDHTCPCPDSDEACLLHPAPADTRADEVSDV